MDINECVIFVIVNDFEFLGQGMVIQDGCFCVEVFVYFKIVFVVNFFMYFGCVFVVVYWNVY